MSPNLELAESGERTFICLTNSFSENSGGRTTAIFRRASMLQSPNRQGLIATFNWKLDYQSVFDAWAHRFSLTSNVSFINFFDAIAGSHSAMERESSKTIRYHPSRYEERGRTKREWIKKLEDGRDAVTILRSDLSVARRMTYKEDTLIAREDFAGDGQLRRKMEFSASGKTTKIEYHDKAGQLLAVNHHPGAKAPLLNVVSGAYFTSGQHVFVKDLHKAWIAALHRTHNRPLFLIDHRMFDGVVLDNDQLDGDPQAVAVIHSTHLNPPYDDTSNIRSYNGKALARSTDFAATVLLTPQQRDDAQSHFEANRLHVIPHPIKWELRSVFRVRTAKRVVVATRLIDLKRVDHMIRAFCIASTKHPTAELHIWGDGEQRAQLESLSVSLGIGPRVVFHGHTTSPQLALATGVLALSTSTNEGFGLSTQEALALGVPVLSYNYRYGPRDLITEGRNGRLLTDGDFKALGASISDALDHPIRTRLWGLAAWWGQRDFRVSIVRSKWIRLLDSL